MSGNRLQTLPSKGEGFVVLESQLTTPRPLVSVIAAFTENGVYGIADGLPWPFGNNGVPGDMARFVAHTTDAPEERVNVLICGRVTFDTMSTVKLGPKRILVGVSKGAYYSNGGERFTVHTAEEALELAAERNAHRVIYIGGEHFWIHGLSVASEALFTLVRREYQKGKGAHVLSKRLDLVADQAGFQLKARVLKCSNTAWARNYEFQTWVRTR